MIRRAPRGGFTLLEILVALGIFVIAIASIMSLLLVAASSHKRAVDNTRAAMLAESILAELEGEVRLGKVLKAREGATHESYPQMTYDVVLDPIDTLAAEVVIVIRWKREGKQREQRFTTVLLGQVQ